MDEFNGYVIAYSPLRLPRLPRTRKAVPPAQFLQRFSTNYGNGQRFRFFGHYALLNYR